MPLKYIKIKHLHARVPFRECLIQFVIRKKESDPVLHSEIEFYAKSISYTVDENIQLTYSSKQAKSLAIYLMAINGSERVACIGFVPLDLQQVFADRKDKLQEMNEQSGYIIYSMQNEPFSDMKHLINVKMSSSSISSEEAVKNKLDKLCLQKSQYKVEDDIEAEKEKQPTPIVYVEKQDNSPVKKFEDSKADLNSTNQHEQLQAFYIEVLKHKIKNAEYFKMIRNNDEFLQHIRDLL